MCKEQPYYSTMNNFEQFQAFAASQSFDQNGSGRRTMLRDEDAVVNIGRQDYDWYYEEEGCKATRNQDSSHGGKSIIWEGQDELQTIWVFACNKIKGCKWGPAMRSLSSNLSQRTSGNHRIKDTHWNCLSPCKENWTRLQPEKSWTANKPVTVISKQEM